MAIVFEGSPMTNAIQTLRHMKAIRWALTAGVMMPYLASLALPAVTGDLDAPNTTAPGLQALLMGFLVNPIGWLANVLLAAGLVLFHAGRFKPAVIIGAAAAACAAMPLVWPLGLALEIGYYMWMSSVVIFLVGSSLCWHLRHRAEVGRSAAE